MNAMSKEAAKRPKRSSATKTTTRTRVAAKSATKKVTKKTIKKAVRKKVAKKTAKKATKKTTKKTAKKVVRKTAAQKSNTMPTHPRAPGRVLGQVFTLSSIGLIRIPYDIDAIAVSTARYGGVLFASFGAVFTVYYAQLALGILPMQQMATVSSSSVEHPDCATGICDGYDLFGHHPDTANPADEYGGYDLEPELWEPEISLDISSNSPLTEMVSIFIGVSEAERVKVYAKNTETGQLLFLGSANQKSDSSWELRWETRQYPNAEYKFKVVAYGNRGAVDDYINTKYLVANETDPVANEVEYDEDGSGTLTDPVVDLMTDSIETEEDISTDPTEGADSETPESNDINTVETEVEEDEVVEEGNPEAGEVNEVEELTKPGTNLKLETAINTNFTLIKVTAADADRVEVYARRSHDNRSQYLGRAARLTSGQWKYYWDTRNVTNGEYEVYVKTFYQGEKRESDTVTVRVKNKIISDTTSAEKEIIKQVALAVEKTEDTTKTPKEMDVQTVKDTIDTVVPEKEDQPAVPKPKPIAQIDLTESNVLTDLEIPAPLVVPKEVKQRVEEKTNIALEDYEERLSEEADRLAAALRSGDDDAVARVKERFENIKTELNKSVNDLVSEDAVIVDNLVARKVAERIVQTEKSERILSERIGITADTDTDGDGITDFDEVEIFKTDPTNPDSDNDGFNDNAEILGGYNPNDAAPEASVAFESPKRAGVTRSDILKVEKIIPLSRDESEEKPDQPEAIISGVALPNSYVTLYVFSNPVVVTMRTDSDGNWSYQFDKEIEDGEHEVYVGVTDNAGRVMAKSEPVRFVKTAEAFTPVDASDEVAVVQSAGIDNNLFNQQMLLLVASISVVSVGLILILLGHWLNHRRPNRPVLVAHSEATAV